MLHRRSFCKALALAPAAFATPALRRSAFADEVSSIVLISQTGLPYLPMMVMEQPRGHLHPAAGDRNERNVHAVGTGAAHRPGDDPLPCARGAIMAGIGYAGRLRHGG